MALTFTHHTPGPGIAFPAGDNDRLTYDRDDVAGSPSVTPTGLAAKVATITFDSSYPTGGEALAASQVELASIVQVVCTPLVKSDGSDAFVLQYNPSTAKLVAFRDTSTNVALTQVPDTTDLSAYSARVLVLGHRTG